MTSESRAHVHELYRVFARYPLRPIAGCPCCVTGADEAALHRTPLRELSASALSTFARKAMTTFGDRDDYRHFLPRICELAEERPTGLGFELWLIRSKLEYGGWESWPEDEQRAIRRWLDAHPAEERTEHAPDPVPEPSAAPVATPPRATTSGPPVVATLELQVPGASAPFTFELFPGRRIAIGRKRDCDVYLPELLAGSINCFIDTDADGASTLHHTGHPFPILVDGVRMGASHALRDGDVIEHRVSDGRVALRTTYRVRT
jgi:hypothetical protein